MVLVRWRRQDLDLVLLLDLDNLMLAIGAQARAKHQDAPNAIQAPVITHVITIALSVLIVYVRAHIITTIVITYGCRRGFPS